MAGRCLKAKIVFEDGFGRTIDLSGDVHSIDVRHISPPIDVSRSGKVLIGEYLGPSRCEFTISGFATNMVMDQVLELFRMGKYHIEKERSNGR
jgi:hypothetical protein